MSKEASYYEEIKEGKVRCNLCGHHCAIEDSKRGICGVRENKNGKLISLNYGKAVAANSDPIEKKPLFHFLPSSRAFSIAAAGCNMSCKYCQNYRISQVSDEIMGTSLPPEEVVSRALELGCETIAYTYSEPTVFFEYAYDTSKLAKKEGLQNVFVTNGYIEEAPLRDIEPILDACNMDLKSFSDDFYLSVTGAGLDKVLESIKLASELDMWLEITTLVIPGLNDSRGEMKEIASFISNLDPSIPWHISRFRPAYKMKDLPATPVEKMKMAREEGEKAGLNHIYMGNLPGDGEDTFCPNCGEKLIERFGFQVRKNRLSQGSCPNCGEIISGVWDEDA